MPFSRDRFSLDSKPEISHQTNSVAFHCVSMLSSCTKSLLHGSKLSSQHHPILKEDRIDCLPCFRFLNTPFVPSSLVSLWLSFTFTTSLVLFIPPYPLSLTPFTSIRLHPFFVCGNDWFEIRAPIIDRVNPEADPRHLSERSFLKINLQ